MTQLPFLAGWKIAFRNLGRNRRRNLISGLAIAFAYAGLVLMGAYIVRTEHYMRVSTVYINHTGHVSIFKNDGLDHYLTRPHRYTLSGEEQTKIAGILADFPEVEFVGRYLLGVGLISNGCLSVPFVGTGIELPIEERIGSHPEVLRWTPELNPMARRPWVGDFASRIPDGISLTVPLAETLDKPKLWSDFPPDQKSPLVVDCNTAQGRAAIPKDADAQLVARAFGGDFSAVDARIVAHHTTGLAFAEETGLVAPLPLLQKLYDTDRVTYVAVYLHPEVPVSAFQRRLEERLKTAGLPVTAYPFFDERVGMFYNGVMNFLLTMALFFYILVLGMIAVTLVNFITMGILERRREIGTLRAVGFLPRDIGRLFFRESAVLTVLGLVSGLVLALAITFVVNRAGIRFRPPGIAGSMSFLLTPDIRLLLAAGLLVGVMALVSAFFTLRRRVGGSIVDLLTS
jgi:putative ABC transport system permease protein